MKIIFLGDWKWSFGWTHCERAFDMLLSRNIQKKVLGNSENLWFPTFISWPTAICSDQRFWWNYQHQKIWRKLEKFGKLLWLFLTLDTKCPDCLTVYCLLLFNSRTDNATISKIILLRWLPTLNHNFDQDFGLNIEVAVGVVVPEDRPMVQDHKELFKIDAPYYLLTQFDLLGILNQ